MAKNDTNIHGMNVNGSDTTPDQFGHFIRDLFNGAVTGLAVAQAGTPNMTVTVAPGTAILTKNTVSSVIAEVKSSTSVTISTANTTNPRIDAIIIYEDTGVTITPYITDGVGGRFKVASVVGTPAASPTAPNDSAVQSEIGAGKPWTRLANVTVAANTTTIISSNISDTRSLVSPSYLADASATPGKWTNPYCFKARASVATTLTDNTTVTIALATEVYDYNGNFASNTYTAPVAGVYHFEGAVSHATGSASPVAAFSTIAVNGVERIRGGRYAGSATSDNTWTVSGEILLAAGDAVTLQHYQDSGGNEASTAAEATTFLSGYLVHRTA